MARTHVPDCPPILNKHRRNKGLLASAYQDYKIAQGDADKADNLEDLEFYYDEMDDAARIIKKLTGSWMIS